MYYTIVYFKLQVPNHCKQCNRVYSVVAWRTHTEGVHRINTCKVSTEALCSGMYVDYLYFTPFNSSASTVSVLQVSVYRIFSCFSVLLRLKEDELDVLNH
jgi:hypothetical protein